MLKYASTMVAAVTLGMVTAFAQPVNAQTTEKPLVLKGQSTHPASSNFHLIFKLWAETVEKMTAGRLKIEGHHVRLTRDGMLVANDVMTVFI